MLVEAFAPVSFPKGAQVITQVNKQTACRHEAQLVLLYECGGLLFLLSRARRLRVFCARLL